MPKPTKGPRLGGGPAHERLLLANLAAALFTHKSIQTTETKAKRLRPLATAVAFAIDDTRDELGNARYLVALACPAGRPCDPASTFGEARARAGTPRMWLAREALRRAGRQ